MVIQAMHGGIVLASIVAVTLLGVEGTLDGQSVVAVLAAAIGFAGASASQIGSLAQAVNGKSVISGSSMADRETTLRTAITGSPVPPIADPDRAAQPSPPEGG